MKIAQIVCTFPPYKGGIGNVAYHFSKILAQKNKLVDVYSPFYNKKDSLENKNNFNLKLLKTPLKFGKGAFLPQLFFLLPKYDIVYLHYPFFGTTEIIWLLKFVFRKKIKLIIHYHMDTPKLSKLMLILSLPSRLVEKSIFKMADTITYASLDYIKNSKIKNIYSQNKEKFYEIPFGVENKFLQNLNYVKNSHDKKQLLFVGGLDKAHYFKGLDILFKALSEVKINFLLTVIGDGDLKKYYKELAKQLRIKKRINFIDEVNENELINQYKKSDLFILPSINNHEAFGIVLIEAMAQGTPVIASNLPGVRSVFENNIQGFLVSPNNVNELKNKIELVFKDTRKYKKMCEKSKLLVLEKYTWDSIGKRINKLVNEIYNENLLNK